MLASLEFICLLLISAPYFAAAYGQPELLPVLQILALNIFLTRFLVVTSAQLLAAFKFRIIGPISFASMVALPFVITGHGVQALIFQRFTGVLVYAVAVCAVTGWRPPRPSAWPVLRASFQFSLPLMQASLVDYVSLTGYVMVIGLRMGAADLGRFRIAQRLVEVLQEIAFTPAAKVFMPVFVAVRHDPDRRFEATMLMLDILAMLIFAAAAISGTASRPLVLLMFGARWSAAVPVFAFMTLMAPITALYGVINPLLTATGQVHLVSAFAWANLAIILAACWLLTILLFIPAMRMGIVRPVLPLLKLLVVPLIALIASPAGCLGGAAALCNFPFGGTTHHRRAGIGHRICRRHAGGCVPPRAPRRQPLRWRGWAQPGYVILS